MSPCVVVDCSENGMKEWSGLELVSTPMMFEGTCVSTLPYSVDHAPLNLRVHVYMQFASRIRKKS